MPFMTEIERAAAAACVPLGSGVLFWSPGPAYETAAEARAALIAGADAVTMSSLPELLAASSLHLEAACLTRITNHTANVTRCGTDHAEVTSWGADGAESLRSMLEELLRAESSG